MLNTLNIFKGFSVIALATTVVTSAQAADPNAGAALAVQCAACHGTEGVSTDAKFPNLAAQKEEYLKLQLQAFKKGSRKNALMEAIAAHLSDEDIDNLSAHFASVKGADPAKVAANETNLDGSIMSFPEGFEKTFTRYHRKDYDDRRQVRYFSGNAKALEGVKNGGPFEPGSYFLVEIYAAKEDANGNLLKDADGKLVQGERKAFTAMQKEAGWGDGVSDIYKNDDWRYSVFKTDHSNKAGVNEAPCMACHKPLTKTDYTFTFDWVKDYLASNTIGYSHKIVK